MAVADVVLRIGSSLGPGGFASLQAGITMVGQFSRVILESVKELDKFSTIMRNVDMETVNFADSMARGQVDTLKLMKQLNAMNIASLKPTKEEFAAISKAATMFAQKTGRDATEVFQKLSDSIIRGTERGLVPFGIQLDETEDKAVAQREALQKVTEMYGSLEVELTTNSQRMYALKNNWDTLIGVIWEAVSQGDGPLGDMLENISDSIGDVSQKLSELPDNTKNYMFSIQSIFDNWTILFGDAADRVEAAQRKLGALTGGMLGDKSFAEKPWDDGAPELKLPSDYVSDSDVKRKPSGGSGKKKFEPDEMTISEEETEWGVYGDPNSVKKYAEAREAVNQKILEGLQEIADAELYNEQLRWDSLKERADWDRQQKELSIIMAEQEYEAELRSIGLKSEQIDQLKQLSALEQDRIVNNMQATAKNAEAIGTIKDSWISAKSSFQMVARAYEEGTQNMTAAGAAFFYIDAIINAVREAALAASAFAKPFGTGAVEGALHVVAAASHAATAVLAAAHGGSSGGGGGGYAVQTPATATAGRYSGGYGGGGDDSISTVNVSISMDDSAKAFGLIVDENYRAEQAGLPSFTRQAS